MPGLTFTSCSVADIPTIFWEIYSFLPSSPLHTLHLHALHTPTTMGKPRVSKSHPARTSSVRCRISCVLTHSFPADDHFDTSRPERG